MEFRHHQLENGLQIVAECNPQAYTTALGFFVNAGSRDETDDVAGVSHFLEHMVFKGTPQRSAADVNRELDEMGSYSNARTSEENTIFYANLLPEFQGRAVELLADIMRPSLRKEDFETEKQVIIEEIRMYEDQPPFGGHEKCMAAYFQSHPLAQSILGTVESITQLTSDQMREYFNCRYSPNNMLLAAAGNVDFDRLVADAQASCGGWKSQNAPRSTPQSEARTDFLVVPKASAAQQYVIQISAGPACDQSDRYAARVLATILGDDSGSRMFWELVDPGRAEYAGIGTYEFQGTGIVMTVLCCTPEDTADNLRRIQDIYQEAEANGITAAELEQAKNKIAAHVILQSERPANRLFAVGMGWMQRHEYRTTEETVSAYRDVTRDNVESVLGKYPLSVNTTLAIGPLETLSL